MKLSRRKLASIGASFLLAAALQTPAGAQDDKVYTLRYQSSYPPALAFNTKNGAGFRELVTEMSNGRIQFEVFDVGGVASVKEMLAATHQGVLDISQSWGAFYSGDIPEADVETGLPLAWQEPWEAYDAYYNRGLRDVVSEAYESRFNVKHFPIIIDLAYGIAMREPVTSIDQLKGKKIRAIGVLGDVIKELGAAPVVIPGAELQTALQLGTIDGLIYGAEAIAAQGLESNLKSMIYSPNLNSGVGHWVMNRDTWNALPEDLQKVIEFAAQYGNLAQVMNYSAAEAEKVAVLQAAGVELVSLPAAERERLNAAAQKIWDKVAERSDFAAKAVEIVRAQQRAIGQLE